VPGIAESELRELMWQSCGIVRTGSGMRAALDRLEAAGGRAAERPARADYELRNLRTVAWLIARCALAREESRGGHYRADFPDKRGGAALHSHIAKDSPNVSFR
jgi:L-aspartate oxidase